MSKEVQKLSNSPVDLPAVTLTHRLQAFLELVSDQHYAVAWDLCCDHGLLGEALLVHGKAEQVVLVDQVPAIMERLERSVAHWPPALQQRLHLKTEQAEHLKSWGDSPQLVVVSGVGGEKTEWILKALTKYSAFRKADWLLSPANDWLEVRHWLQQEDFSLRQQGVLVDNGWCYDYLWVSGQQHLDSVSLVNPEWNTDHPVQAAQLRRIHRHYRNLLKSPHRYHASWALSCYDELFERL